MSGDESVVVEARMEAIRTWVGSLAEDVEVARAVLEAEGAHREARKLAAAALAYLVTRLDLIPDWNETIGVVDDALVLRICMDLASVHHPEQALDPGMRARMARLTNDVDVIAALLGRELFTRLRRHCRRLPDVAVRGHSPTALTTSAEARQVLYAEVATDLARLPAVSFSDAAALESRLRSYLHYKLQGR